MSKYLNENPLPWLLENNDPVIKYLTLRDICDAPPSELLTNYDNIMKSDAIREILSKTTDGILGDSKNFDTYYRGTIWNFAYAITLGLNKSDEVIRNSAEFIFKRCQT